MLQTDPSRNTMGKALHRRPAVAPLQCPKSHRPAAAATIPTAAQLCMVGNLRHDRQNQ